MTRNEDKKPRHYTEKEYTFDPDAVLQEADENGCAVVVGTDGEPHFTISVLQEDLPYGQDDRYALEGRLEWVTAWALRALDAMARVAPDATRFEDLEEEWDGFSYREVSWFRERAMRLAKDLESKR